MTTITKKIQYGQEVKVQEGSVIELDSGRQYNRCEKLSLDTTEPCPGWPGADFRFPSPLGHGLAVNVKITGRTKQWRDGAWWVRVQLEWVGDCEPSTFSKAWLLVK